MEPKAMSAEPRLSSGSAAERYEALLRISEALPSCSESEELARVLADQLHGVIPFDHLIVLVLNENSDEVQWHAWARETSSLQHERLEESPLWQVYNSPEMLVIADWTSDERYQRQTSEAVERTIGSVVCVPLTTQSGRLGTFGI